MTSVRLTEHFVTHFDSLYLPLGLCLYRSLEDHGRPFHLWIVALDEPCAATLARLGLEHATIVPLRDVEDDRLRAVRPERTIAEYCWTLTPFLPGHVLGRAPHLERVTYLDADMYFFEHPAALLEGFERSDKHVQITEHDFAPEYAANLRYGRYCVQFMTFRNTPAAMKVMRWWQERCLEWCYAREEAGKFGDQKYLDAWPEMFAAEVHVLAESQRTLAPWNVAQAARRSGRAAPVSYHFHNLRIESPTRVVLFHTYRVGWRNRWIYQRYLRALREAVAQLRRLGVEIKGRPVFSGPRAGLRMAWQRVTGRAALASL